jgi:predicted Zn-dependent protease
VPGLLGPDEARGIADAALDTDGADGVEVLFMHRWGGLTRFARSSVHQSTWSEDTGVHVRVVTGGRQGVAAFNELTVDGARAAAASALEMARVSTPDPLFPGLAPKADVPERPGSFDEATANVSPVERADRVAELIGEVGDGFHAAGALDTGAAEIAVATSEGQFCYSATTQSTLATVVSGGDGSAGTAEVAGPRLADIDTAAAGSRAFRKARDSQSPRALEPGRYEVVLEPLAVSTLIAFLSYVGFGGRAIAEGRSPFTGKEGQEVCGQNVTIFDDGLSPLTIGVPFDFEGTPRRRVDIIERGVFRQGVHDRRSAKQAGTESTGHALPAPNPEGAFPLNLFLETGDATVEDMVRATRRGLLVTRFHYSNIVNPMETTITGMTRDGTWLIEDGEIVHPVRNLRFTQSILEALSNVELIGRDSMIASEFFFAASRVPALKISSFNFSSRSDH